ncbi:MAG: hypothetical protein WCI97_01105 [Bacteroidota bacterium]
MTNNFKTILPLFIVMSLFSCSKEKIEQNKSKKLSGDWEMQSRKVGGEDFFRVGRIYFEDSLINQCGDTIQYNETSTVKNDTLSFISGGTLKHSTVTLKTALNYFPSYTNCIITDTSFSDYFSTTSPDARNYPHDIQWVITYDNHSNETHLTITEPWKLYMPDGTEVWYSYTYLYEIVTLNRNDLIIKGIDYPCFFGYVTTDEVIRFKRIR